MAPAEWIALVALALSVVVPTLASWRAAAVRDAQLASKIDGIATDVAELKRELAVEREARHRLEIEFAKFRPEHDDD